MRFLDTCSLLKVNLEKESGFTISSVTLQELENIKSNKNKTENVRYKARSASRWLRDNQDKYDVVIYTTDMEHLITDRSVEVYPDSKIIACVISCGDDVEFYTDDVSCYNISKRIFGLNVNYIDNSEEDVYLGYKKITGNTSTINLAMETMDYNEWCVNEYLIIENIDDNTTKEMRFDGEKFVALKLPPSKVIKGKNALQRCALDILNNPDITISAILGGYGSGKTMLTTKMSLYQVNEKGNQSFIDIVREPKGEGDSVGFLKGTFEDKTDQFFLPFVQQMDGGEFEMESLKQRGVLSAHIPYYCKGLTFSHSIVVVDEAEDLDEKQIRLIGTRIGEGSRIFLNGDYKQSVIRSTTDNALIKMCNSLKGNTMFATVYLGEDVRSTTSKVFSHIFE